MDKGSTSSSGLGILGVLQIIFAVLKLAKVGAFADWPWVKVLIPFWIFLAGTVLVVIVWTIVAVILSRR